MWTLGHLAEITGGELVGNPSTIIKGVAPLQEAVTGDISFAENLKILEKYREQTQATALIVPKQAREVGRPHIKVGNPRLAFARVLQEFAWKTALPPGVHPTAVVDETAEIGAGAAIGPHVVVEAGAQIGKGTVVMAGVYIGQKTVVGENCIIYPNCCLRERVQIGNRVILHAGSVIGSDGFGYVNVNGKQFKVPHIGTVIIHDDVELGANVTVDRGTCGATVIGRGTKVDNLVQIGHNVQIGEDCLVVAMSGVAGSARLGNRVTLAGQSGIAGHITIGDDCVVAARGLVAADLEPGSFVSGFPARPHQENMRILAAQRKVPDLLKQVKELKRQVEALSRCLEKEVENGENEED